MEPNGPWQQESHGSWADDAEGAEAEAHVGECRPEWLAAWHAGRPCRCDAEHWRDTLPLALPAQGASFAQYCWWLAHALQPYDAGEGTEARVAQMYFHEGKGLMAMLTEQVVWRTPGTPPTVPNLQHRGDASPAEVHEGPEAPLHRETHRPPQVHAPTLDRGEGARQRLGCPLV